MDRNSNLITQIYTSLAQFFLVLTITSCSRPPSPDELSLLEQEVMAIHDSVMPKMTKIYYDKEYLDEWLQKDSIIQNPDLHAQALNCTRELKIAEDAMWKWMSDYSDNFEPLAEESDSVKIAFLMQEKQSIITVRNLMLNSMAKADSIKAVIEKGE